MNDENYKPENAITWAFTFITLLIVSAFAPALFDFFSAHQALALAWTH